MKIFATAKILRAKRASSPAASKIFSMFSIQICINCVGKMLRGIMELLLNNYLVHFLIIEKIFDFLFIESAVSQHLCYMLTSKCPGIPNATDRIGCDLNVSLNQGHQSPL